MQGHQDFVLSERGREQAQRLARWLSAQGIGWDHAYTSPLSRARETAEIVCELTGHSTPDPEADLAELAAGTLEGLDRAQMAEKFPLFLAAARHGNRRFCRIRRRKLRRRSNSGAALARSAGNETPGSREPAALGRPRRIQFSAAQADHLLAGSADLHRAHGQLRGDHGPHAGAAGNVHGRAGLARACRPHGQRERRRLERRLSLNDGHLSLWQASARCFAALALRSCCCPFRLAAKAARQNRAAARRTVGRPEAAVSGSGGSSGNAGTGGSGGTAGGGAGGTGDTDAGETCTPGSAGPTASSVCLREVTGRVVDEAGAPISALLTSVCGPICYNGETDATGAFKVELGVHLELRDYSVTPHGRPNRARVSTSSFRSTR